MIIDLNLKGRQVVIAGGGREATKKVEAILSQDCEIFVHSENFSDEELVGKKRAGCKCVRGAFRGETSLKVTTV